MAYEDKSEDYLLITILSNGYKNRFFLLCIVSNFTLVAEGKLKNIGPGRERHFFIVIKTKPPVFTRWLCSLFMDRLFLFGVAG